jgi:tetratricopeptide (TPR) repeat protein
MLSGARLAASPRPRRCRGVVAAAARAALLLAGCSSTPEATAATTLKDAWDAARAGDLDRGAELARRASEERPGFVDPLYLLAAIEEKRSNFEAARDAYRQILSTDPTATRAAVALAGTLAAESRFDEAEQLLRAAIEEDPGAEPAAFNLGEMADRRSAPDEACAWFALSSALDTRDPRALARIAEIRLRQGRAQEALAAARDVVARAPKWPPGRRILAAAEAAAAR